MLSRLGKLMSNNVLDQQTQKKQDLNADLNVLKLENDALKKRCEDLECKMKKVIDHIESPLERIRDDDGTFQWVCKDHVTKL